MAEIDATEIVLADLKQARKRVAGNAGSVGHKLLRTSDGKPVRVLSLDANSSTFIDDLTIVFEKNVAKAREENKKLVGSRDGIVHEK